MMLDSPQFRTPFRPRPHWSPPSHSNRPTIITSPTFLITSPTFLLVFTRADPDATSSSPPLLLLPPSGTAQVERPLLVAEFRYEHDDAWTTNINLFKEFTDISRGVRRFGAAAVGMCHVAFGIVEAYSEYHLKPWDMVAGVLIVEEANGILTSMDGESLSIFDGLFWSQMV